MQQFLFSGKSKYVNFDLNIILSSKSGFRYLSHFNDGRFLQGTPRLSLINKKDKEADTLGGDKEKKMTNPQRKTRNVEQRRKM